MVRSSLLPEAEIPLWVDCDWRTHAGYDEDFDDGQRRWLLVVVTSLGRLKGFLLPGLRIGVHGQESELSSLVPCNYDRHGAVEHSKRFDRALLLALLRLLLWVMRMA